jgi:tetratricopeptide (TPR) repeat protein
MGQQRRRLTPARSALDLWGAELRAWRDRRGLSLAGLCDLVRYDPSYLARLERAERFPPEHVAQVCDRELDTGGELVRLWQLADTERKRGSPDVASPATHVAISGPEVDPHLAITAASEGEEIIIPCRSADGRIIWVSVPRRNLLTGGLGLAAGAAMGTLAGPVDGRARHTRFTAGVADVDPVGHLRHLRTILVDSDNLLGPRSVIRAVRDHIGVIQQLREQHNGADRRALLQVQAEYAEFAGWLHQDVGDCQAAGFWLDRALELAHAGGDPEFPVFVLARKSQLAGDMRDAARAVDMADAAMATGQGHRRLTGVALTYAAHGHALDGTHKASMHALDRARQQLDRSIGDDPPARLAKWLDASYIEVQRARCLSVLGEHPAAAAIFEQAIEDLPPQYRRDRGVYLARAGRAHACGGEPERAVAAGMQALAIADQTGSGRIVTELATLDSELARWKATPLVTEFREAFAETLPRQVPAPGNQRKADMR